MAVWEWTLPHSTGVLSTRSHILTALLWFHESSVHMCSDKRQIVGDQGMKEGCKEVDSGHIVWCVVTTRMWGVSALVVYKDDDKSSALCCSSIYIYIHCNIANL